MTKKSSTIGTRLRAAREARGISQADMARDTGFHQAAVNHFEQDRRTPSAFNLYKLCLYLEVSADTILGLPKR